MKNLFVVLALVLVFAPVRAEEVRSDTEAQQVFDEMRANYASAETLSLTVLPDATKNRPKVEFSFKHPNRYSVSVLTPEFRTKSVSNGRTNYWYHSRQDSKQYYALPIPPERIGRAGIMQYQPLGFLMTPIVAGVDPFSAPWGKEPKRFFLKKPTTINGKDVIAVAAQLSSNYNEINTYFIGKQDRLLYRITQAGEYLGRKYTISESYENIRINPRIPIDTFAFVPPPNTRQGNWIRDYLKSVRMPDDIRPGSIPRPLEGADLSGEAVRLEDHKGKVVLLDFWATWCGPCLVEVPHVKAAYKKFRDQGFVVIGISFDEDRAALEKYVKENNMPWPQIFDGKMFKSQANKDYKVGAIPFTLLIGRDGKIAAFNPRALLLELEIEKALAAPSQ